MSAIKTKDDGDHLLIPFIKEIIVVSDKHEWIDKPIEKSGLPREHALAEIARIFSNQSEWTEYKNDIEDWIVNKKVELHLC